MSVVYSPERRLCGFPSDKGGELIDEYNHNFCLYECVWKRIKEECGCIPGNWNQTYREVFCFYIMVTLEANNQLYHGEL